MPRCAATECFSNDRVRVTLTPLGVMGVRQALQKVGIVMAHVSHMSEWKPLPSDVADWMGSVEESDLLGRPADAAAPVDIPRPRSLRERLVKMLAVEKRAS